VRVGQLSGQRLVDLAADMLKARAGDLEARQRLLHDGLPLAADIVRPGAGHVLKVGLEFLNGAGINPATPADAAPELPDYDHFVSKLLARRFGTFVVCGEPDSGKTVLALRLAERYLVEHGYQVVAVGGIHPDDRLKWRTDDWIEYEAPERFAKAMSAVSQAMLAGTSYPRDLKKRVVLLDDASLVAHISQAAMVRALMRAWSAARHLDWVLILTARSFKSITTVAQGSDARFLKRPNWDALTKERPEAREWWEAAERAFRQLRKTLDWQQSGNEKEWVFVQAESFGFEGLMRYALPGTVDEQDDGA
jgi:hypothetical protein